MKKKQVIILYGGKSVEHEVSCRSAAYIYKHLDRERYQPVPVAIDKEGYWWPQYQVPIDIETMPVHQAGERKLRAMASPFDCLTALAGLDDGVRPEELIVFPIIHGAGGEDGTLQGFLDMAGVPWVGPCTLGSAIGMDKVIAKSLVEHAGVQVLPHEYFDHSIWKSDKEEILRRAVERFTFPLFVKPVALGSSVGVAKVDTVEALEQACATALQLDLGVMIEPGRRVREIECAVMGVGELQVTYPGEVNASKGFYSYEAKYEDPEGAIIKVPADLTPEQAEKARSISSICFRALRLSGMSRIDLFLDQDDGNFYFNEVNTLPGFTAISQFPLLWQAEGLSPCELLSTLVGYAEEEGALRRQLLKQRPSG